MNHRPVTTFGHDYNQRPAKRIETGKGIFHMWGSEIFEQEGESQSYTVAIVERENGAVETIHPTLIRFDDAPVSNEEPTL